MEEDHRHSVPWPLLVVAIGFCVLAANSLILGGGPVLLFAPIVWGGTALMCAASAVVTMIFRDNEKVRILSYTAIATHGAFRSAANLGVGALAPLGVWLIVGGLLAAAIRAHERNEMLMTRNKLLREKADALAAALKVAE